METKANFNTRLLFTSNLAIFTIGLGFAVRAAIADDLRVKIFNVIDAAQSATMVGQALGYDLSWFRFHTTHRELIGRYFGLQTYSGFLCLEQLGRKLTGVVGFDSPSRCEQLYHRLDWFNVDRIRMGRRRRFSESFGR